MIDCKILFNITDTRSIADEISAIASEIRMSNEKNHDTLADLFIISDSIAEWERRNGVSIFHPDDIQDGCVWTHHLRDDIVETLKKEQEVY